MGSSHSSTPSLQDAPFIAKEMIKKTQIISPDHYYQFIEQLGEGNYATIFKVRCLVTGELRVVKKVQRTKSPTLGRHLMNEYDILKEMDHPNIIKMYEMFEDSTHCYIVTEYLNGRDALDLLQMRKIVTEEEAFGMFYQALLAINYLHKIKVMHRDIKLQNMIYDPHSRSLKLIDFGSALKYDKTYPRQRRCTGTMPYIAPQVLNKYYNNKCDIWSLGIFLYALLSGNAPFVGKDHDQIIQKINKETLTFSSPIWEKRTKEVKVLIQKMLQKNFENRIGSNQILKEDWIINNIQKKGMHKAEKENVQNCLQNMLKFRKIKIGEMQLGVLVFMVNFIIKLNDQIGLRKSFQTIDSQKDGQIDEKELKLALIQFLGHSPKNAEQQAKELMQAVDFDNSGFITYSQFIIACCDLRQVLNNKNISNTFSYIDTDNSGSLSVEQMKRRLGDHLQQSYYSKVMKQFDRDGDGQISKKQFQNMMKSILKTY